MIILDATTKSLQIKLGGAITTNQLPFSASYVDSTGTTTTPGEQDGVTNSTTAVTIVSAPAASTQRLIKNIIIQNADTAAATVTIIYNNNSTLRNIFIATLAVGDQLIYEDGNGWVAVDKNGNLKTSGSGSSGGVIEVDGTWTPSDVSGASLTFTNTSGNCLTRHIGNMMFATFMITWPSTTDSSAAKVGGLLTSAATSNDVSPVIISFTDLGQTIYGRVAGSATNFTLYTTSGTSITNANMSGKTIRGMAVYAV